MTAAPPTIADLVAQNVAGQRQAIGRQFRRDAAWRRAHRLAREIGREADPVRRRLLQRRTLSAVLAALES